MNVSTGSATGGQPFQRVPLTVAERFAIFDRDNFTCCYCNTFTYSPEVDHVLPVCAGGGNHWSNLATACWRCNRSKAGSIVELDMNDVCARAVQRHVDQRWPNDVGLEPFGDGSAGGCAYQLASLTFDDGGDIPAMIAAVKVAGSWSQAADALFAIRDQAWIACGSLQAEEV